LTNKNLRAGKGIIWRWIFGDIWRIRSIWMRWACSRKMTDGLGFGYCNVMGTAIRFSSEPIQGSVRSMAGAALRDHLVEKLGIALQQLIDVQS
jgi:hypothetical protein